MRGWKSVNVINRKEKGSYISWKNWVEFKVHAPGLVRRFHRLSSDKVGHLIPAPPNTLYVARFKRCHAGPHSPPATKSPSVLTSSSSLYIPTAYPLFQKEKRKSNFYYFSQPPLSLSLSLTVSFISVVPEAAIAIHKMGVRENDPRSQLSLPPGFRFFPTDEELLVQYLCRKVAGHHFPLPIIGDIDLYKFDPWDLPSKLILVFSSNSKLGRSF